MTSNRSPFSPTIDSGRPWRPPLAGLFFGMVALGGSHAHGASVADSPAVPVAVAVAGADTVSAPGNAKEVRMWMTVGNRRFAVTLADTDAARAFATRLPLALDMTDLNGNEKKFDLPKDLPANASRPGTIRNGDLMLYGAGTVVLFYLTFDSPYAYTRLGRVDDPSGLAQVLGARSVKIEFSRR
jgi:hypothetical protein